MVTAPEIVKRGETFSNVRHAPILGGLSILAFFGALAFGYFSPMSPYPGAEVAMGDLVRSITRFCYGSIAVVIIAVLGLVRHERPRWLAIVGLCLGALPAIGGVYIAMGAPL